MHPILYLLRWDDVVGAILPILLLTTDADVVVIVVYVVYLVVDEVVGCHLVQPLDVDVLLCLCFDVLLVGRWVDDDGDPFFPFVFDVPFSCSDGRFEVDLGVSQVCFDDRLALLDVLLFLDVLFSSILLLFWQMSTLSHSPVHSSHSMLPRLSFLMPSVRCKYRKMIISMDSTILMCVLPMLLLSFLLMLLLRMLLSICFAHSP